MIGVLVNAAGVLVGGSIGLLAKKGIPPNWSQVMLKGIALCVPYVLFISAWLGPSVGRIR